MREKVTLKIERLLCRACARNVERALKGIEGVVSAQVDLASKRGRVVIEPEKISPEQVASAVDRADLRLSAHRALHRLFGSSYQALGERAEASAAKIERVERLAAGR